MKKILSMFDSLRPADLVTIACVGLIGVFMFITLTGCGHGLPLIGGLQHNADCKNNLKEIKTALIEYESKFKTLPDRGGDLFLAKLYLTGSVTDWDTFICPADAAEDSAGYVLADIERKCPPPDGKWHEYEEYLDEDYEGEQQESQYYLDVERDWRMSTESDRTFEPGEISYAAVWNKHGSEDESDMESMGWRRSYELRSVSSRVRKPLVCDDFESENEDEDDIDDDKVRMVHGDHVNVLYTNGDVAEVKNLKAIGEDSNLVREGFDALRN